MSVSPPESRSASLDPMIAWGPGLHRSPLPEPKLQTTWFVAGFTSITLLLNWSVMRRLPTWLKPDELLAGRVAAPIGTITARIVVKSRAMLIDDIIFLSIFFSPLGENLLPQSYYYNSI